MRDKQREQYMIYKRGNGWVGSRIERVVDNTPSHRPCIQRVLFTRTFPLPRAASDAAATPRIFYQPTTVTHTIVSLTQFYIYIYISYIDNNKRLWLLVVQRSAGGVYIYTVYTTVVFIFGPVTFGPARVFYTFHARISCG